METGGRVTPLEQPITMRSIVGNVGFSINNRNLLQQSEPITYTNEPF
jgi:hypothetical protein